MYEIDVSWPPNSFFNDDLMTSFAYLHIHTSNLILIDFYQKLNYCK